MKAVKDWTTPAEIREKLLQRWNHGRVLAARLGGEEGFPIRFLLHRPDRRELLDRFNEVRNWIRELEEGSAAARGFGYEIDWEEVNHRQLGANRIPRAVTIGSEGDLVRLIGRAAEAQRFTELVEMTLTEFPELKSWLARRPLVALEEGERWEQVLSVIRWFRSHPMSSVYLRQVDAPGVHTKFIEARKGLLAELLDAVLRPEQISPEMIGAANFERRYGLKTKPAQVRLRILDPALAVRGLTDLATPVEQLAALDLPAERVFVTENDTNALAFPAVASAVVMFGRGYALDLLAQLPWLHRAQVHYWGDVDTHGFAILDKFRAEVPEAQSLLMDRETLVAHRTAWTQETEDQRCLKPLMRLSAEEKRLYDDLRGDRIGSSVRLEQERISYGWLLSALEAL